MCFPFVYKKKVNMRLRCSKNRVFIGVFHFLLISTYTSHVRV